MGWWVLLRLRYVVRPIGDHTKVGCNFRLCYTNNLSHTQGVRRDREESLDRLLPVFYEFRAGCSRDRYFGLSRVASRYDLPLFPLKRTSEANP